MFSKHRNVVILSMKEKDFGLSAFFFRVFPAVSGALLGSIFSLGFFLALKIGSGSETDDPQVFSRFVLFATVFVAAIAGNLLAVIFSSVAAGEDLAGKFRTALLHIFFSTIGLFALVAPLFLTLSLETALDIVLFFLPFSAISAGLFFRIFAESEQPVLAAYEAIFGGFFTAAILSLLFPALIPIEMMPFFALPLAWFLLSSVGFLVGKIFSRMEKHGEESTSDQINEKR